MSFEIITKIIRDRKTTYAYDFSNKKIDKTILESLITNALWAPTHKLTQPWRFVVLEGKHQEDLGNHMAEYYRALYDEEEFSNERYEETKEYAKNATLLALIFQPSKRAQLPEWEEIAAISSAVQNMWLSCTALNIGSYWDTAEATMSYGKQIQLEEGEKFLGIFYMGYLKEGIPSPNRRRKPLSKKLSWDFKE
ncbi:Nitroreductase [Tenacibaculum maritimum]|uniref:nitroreductase family protein n=1 Tax=Tenacibaculum maritimum TaxID=107401 RepID=UPI0012E5D991|nr:nitroreductase [Tenacibaculum maritimum]CAA0155983.1 Nitroreductase [Tenacibaculum maritimum]CAA0187571.1 Nitroreductase [Tenacibaculum maritimum]CAA0215089.1 Nitroreductase [Tenacibaculum maritimum]